MAAGAAGDADRRTERWAPVQGAALVAGFAFVILGVVGFIPGITNYHEGMKIAGHPETGAMMLHFFHVSILHNVVHLLFGVAGLLLARSITRARAFLVGGGVFYLALWLYGLLIKLDSAANFLPVNAADNWLHFAIGAGMLLFGVLLGSTTRSRPAGAAPGPTGTGV